MTPIACSLSSRESSVPGPSVSQASSVSPNWMPLAARASAGWAAPTVSAQAATASKPGNRALIPYRVNAVGLIQTLPALDFTHL